MLPEGLLTAPASAMPLDDVAFRALVATLAEAVDLTWLPVTATLPLPAPEPVSTLKADPAVTEEITVAEAANDCTLLTTPEASSLLLANKFRLLPVVLALALANTLLLLKVTVLPGKAPLLVRPLVPVSMVAVVALEALWALITAKSAPVTLEVPATEEDTAPPRPNTLAPLTVKVLKASFLLATAEAVLPLRVMVESVITPDVSMPNKLLSLGLVVAETVPVLVWLEDTAAVKPLDVPATKPLCWATLSSKVLPALLPTASDAMLLPVKPKLLSVTAPVATLIEPPVLAVVLELKACTLVTAKSALTVALLPVVAAATLPVPVPVAVLAVTSNLLPTTLLMAVALMLLSFMDKATVSTSPTVNLTRPSKSAKVLAPLVPDW